MKWYKPTYCALTGIPSLDMKSNSLRWAFLFLIQGEENELQSYWLAYLQSQRQWTGIYTDSSHSSTVYTVCVFVRETEIDRVE